ncbi:MAG: anti-sigma factor [Azospirillaceae bacterium]
MTGPGAPQDPPPGGAGPSEPPSDDPSVLAGEFVLGVLDPEAEAAVRARLDGDPALAAEVAFWRSRLAGLDAAVARDGPAPRQETWERIERTLSGRGATAVGVARPAPPPDAPPPGRSSGLVWRAATVAASAVAIVLAALLFIGPEGRVPGIAPPAAPAPAMPAYVALLESDDGAPAWLVEAHGDGTLVAIPLDVPAAEDGQAYELWALPPDDAPPRSLGLVGRRADRRALEVGGAGDSAGTLGPAEALAVSLEPPGGSPTGAPTGPVVAVGAVRPVSEAP